MKIWSESMETLFSHFYIVFNLIYIFWSIIPNMVCLHANSTKQRWSNWQLWRQGDGAQSQLMGLKVMISWWYSSSIADLIKSADFGHTNGANTRSSWSCLLSIFEYFQTFSKFLNIGPLNTECGWIKKNEHLK